MNIVRLNDEHKQQYEKFVIAHPSGSFLQSWDWGDFQTKHGKQVIRYGIFETNSLKKDELELVGTVQLLQTKVPLLQGTYLYAPYGPLINKNQAELINDLVTKIKNDFSNSWFIRIEPKDELPIKGEPSVHIQPGSTLVTNLLQSEEELLSGMHPKTRYNIKVAAKHGVRVSSEAIGSPEAIKLLSETSKRQSYKSYSNTYYTELLKFLAPTKPDSLCTAWLYQATYENSVIASAIMIDYGTTRTYLFGGSDNSKRNLMAPYALHWKAILDAKNKGFQAYDWWGIETATGETPGFVQFKLRWGGTQKLYAKACDIILNQKWYRAYSVLRKINRFF